MSQVKAEWEYLLNDNPHDPELARLRLLEAALDPMTVQCLDAVEVEKGWRCLDVGAGAASVARLLSERVGPEGEVVALDYNTRFLTDLPGNVAVVNADMRDEGALEQDAFDLVHCRWTLMWLPDQMAALKSMSAALRPGGILLVEEADPGPGFYAFGYPGAQQHNDAVRRHPGSGLPTGPDRFWYLPGTLIEAGLEFAGARYSNRAIRSGDPLFDALRLTARVMEPEARAHGESQEDISARKSVFEQHGAWLVPFTQVSAWGRRPS